MPEGDGDEHVVRTHGAGHFGCQPAGRIEQHHLALQHGEQITQQQGQRLGAQLTGDVDGMRLGEQPCRIGQQLLAHRVEQTFEGGDVAHHQIMKDALPALAGEFGIERADALAETGCRGRQPRLEHRLQVLEAGVAQPLRETHEARGMHATLGGDGIDRFECDDIGILGEEARNLL